MAFAGACTTPSSLTSDAPAADVDMFVDIIKGRQSRKERRIKILHVSEGTLDTRSGTTRSLAGDVRDHALVIIPFFHEDAQIHEAVSEK